MQYHGTAYAADSWDVYWFEKNLQGDIVAIYDEGGTKVVEYKYTAFGEIGVSSYVGSDAYITKNPFTYRGYYYDFDLEMYYLGSRYYDAKVGRFINADTTGILSISPFGLSDKNLFAYCDNNPVMRIDRGGQYWETVLDVISLGLSIVDVKLNPDDFWSWAGLAGDVLDIIIPCIGGIGEAVRAYRAYDLADDFYDAYKAIDVADDIYDTVDTVGDLSDLTIDSYKNLRKISAGTGNEVHHIIEKRFAKSLDLGSESEMLSITLDKQTHRAFTNAWRKSIGYGEVYDIDKVYNSAMRIYKNHPTLLDAAMKTLGR